MQLIRAHTEIALLSLFVGLSIVLPSLMPVTLAVGGAFAIWRIVTTRSFAPRTPLESPLFALLLLAFLNLLFVTPDRAVSLPSFLQLLVSALLFFALINWANSEARLLVAVVLLAVAGVLFAAVFPLMASGNLPVIGRFIPLIRALLPIDLTDTVNSNILGGLFTLLIPLASALLLFSTKRVTQLLGLFATLSIGGMLILSQSRGGIFATAVAIIVLIFLRFALIRFILPMIVVAMGGIAALLVARPELLGGGNIVGGSTVSLAGRIEIYSRAIYMFQDFPFTGVGMNFFGTVLDLLYPLFTIAPGNIAHAHNIFLQIGAELGIIALMCWVAAEMLIILLALTAFRRATTPTLRCVSAAALVAQISLLLHGLIDATLWNTRPAPFVWAVWGIAVASSLVVSRQHKSENPPIGGLELSISNGAMSRANDVELA